MAFVLVIVVTVFDNGSMLVVQINKTSTKKGLFQVIIFSFKKKEHKREKYSSFHLARKKL